LSPILQPGWNCWRIEPASRAEVLIDGAAYFAAFRAAAKRARHSIFVVGCDVDSRTTLVREGPADELPTGLGPFLDALVRRQHGLGVFLLDWDFAMLYAADRELLPIYKLGWRTHRRLRFHLHDQHPVGASHHQSPYPSRLALGPLPGFVYGLIGSLSGAALTYGIGHALGRDAVRRLAGSRLNSLSRRLARRGLLAVRVIPVAPCTVVNLVAGPRPSVCRTSCSAPTSAWPRASSR
jgi:hypothetical protein